MHLMGFQVYSFSMSFNYFFLIISLFFNINALMYKIIKREREKNIKYLCIGLGNWMNTFFRLLVSYLHITLKYISYCEC
jgi:hypothetical protein